MKSSLRQLNPVSLRNVALFALACGALSPFCPNAKAAPSTAPTTLQPLADKAPSLPLKSTFEKVTGEGGPYALKLKNTSKQPLTVNVKVLLSVTFHAESKARVLPEHVIEADQVWTISELAADDKVVITAKAYSPLELTVP